MNPPLSHAALTPETVLSSIVIRSDSASDIVTCDSVYGHLAFTGASANVIQFVDMRLHSIACIFRLLTSTLQNKSALERENAGKIIKYVVFIKIFAALERGLGLTIGIFFSTVFMDVNH